MDDPSSTEALRGTSVSPARRPSPALVDSQPLTVDCERLADLAAMVLTAEGYPADTELTITLVTDDEMAEHNRRALGRDGPTDVLAFPIEALRPGEPPTHDDGGPPVLVGDVVIAPAYVSRQAAELGVQPEDELALMVVHGVLHLLGYDHAVEDDAEVMEAREADLLARIGVRRR